MARDPPAVDLAAAGTKRPPSQPWAAIARFIDAHGFDRRETNYGFQCRIRGRLGRSRNVVFAVDATTMFDGHLTNVDMNTTTTVPNARDPASAYNFAVSVTFSREEADPHACAGHVHLISHKPTHGVASGSDAIGIAIALGRMFGCRTLSLFDASRITCPTRRGASSTPQTLLLRRARILSRGQGWYESKGFRSVIEALEPNAYRSTVGKLHTIRVADLVAALADVDRALRSALLGGSGAAGRLRIAKYGMKSPEPEVSDRVSVADIVATMQTASVAYEILKDATATHAATLGATLGDVVDAMIAKDCGTASVLVDALLPRADTFNVVLTDAEGRAVKRLPRLDAWVFAWRLVSTYSDMVLTLRATRSDAT
jgi:hypothetical protein